MTVTNEVVEVVVWVLVDESGDYVAHADPEKLGDVWAEEIGDVMVENAQRLIKVTLTVPKPKPVELKGSVPAEANEGELKVA